MKYSELINPDTSAEFFRQEVSTMVPSAVRGRTLGKFMIHFLALSSHMEAICDVKGFGSKTAATGIIDAAAACSMIRMPTEAFAEKFPNGLGNFLDFANAQLEVFAREITIPNERNEVSAMQQIVAKSMLTYFAGIRECGERMAFLLSDQSKSFTDRGKAYLLKQGLTSKGLDPDEIAGQLNELLTNLEPLIAKLNTACNATVLADDKWLEAQGAEEEKEASAASVVAPPPPPSLEKEEDKADTVVAPDDDEAVDAASVDAASVAADVGADDADAAKDDEPDEPSIDDVVAAVAEVHRDDGHEAEVADVVLDVGDGPAAPDDEAAHTSEAGSLDHAGVADAGAAVDRHQEREVRPPERHLDMPAEDRSHTAEAGAGGGHSWRQKASALVKGWAFDARYGRPDGLRAQAKDFLKKRKERQERLKGDDTPRDDGPRRG